MWHTETMLLRSIIPTAFLGLAAAESGLDGWLRYAALPSDMRENYKGALTSIVALNSTETSPMYTAGKELQNGLRGILGQEIELQFTSDTTNNTIVVGTVDAFTKAGLEIPDLAAAEALKEDGFWLSAHNDNVRIVGQNERGALYGAFEYLSMLAQGNFTDVAYATSPSAPIRWVNQWDNLDATGTHGSIERGYAGPSIFFANGAIVDDLARVAQYARLLASIRINGIVINNVNADYRLLDSDNMAGVGRIADAMRPYGVRVGVSLYFDSPRNLSNLATSDPLDPDVIEFWNGVTDDLYEHVPDLLGYLVKANSEGQPGPLLYNRTLAEGANMFARALKPHGDGIVMFRAFVYDHNLSELNWYNDRANAAVEFFEDLDGQFDDNVVIQIKYGPIDFQVREPPSPLFANLLETSAAIELQVTQEYLGQQSHLVYLPPLWKTILDYDLRVGGEPSVIRDILSGARFNRSRTGYAAVVNVGMHETWLGSHPAMSNLYAYGRLAWDPLDDEVAMLEDWTRLTFGLDRTVVDTVTKMSMESWPAYENYSGNLGIQTLTDILYTHYGPHPASQDGNGWGQWTRANNFSIGMDRTVRNGTGFSGQYPPEVAAVFEEVETTPDNLLLWFHHVPYTQPLKSGRTVIQHFYDAHYAGAATAQTFRTQWAGVRGLIDDERFDDVALRLEYQAGHSIVWRDAISNFYWNLSGIADEADRVGNHPWRIEAEDMEMDGYEVVAVTPFETASKYQAVRTTSNDTVGSVATTIDYLSGTYDIAVNYYDVMGGVAKYEIFLNDESIGAWAGDLENTLGHEFSEFLDGHSATRVTFRGVEVKQGDVLRITGQPDGIERAPLDYVVLLPEGVVD